MKISTILAASGGNKTLEELKARVRMLVLYPESDMPKDVGKALLVQLTDISEWLDSGGNSAWRSIAQFQILSLSFIIAQYLNTTGTTHEPVVTKINKNESISVLELNSRADNCLTRIGIITIKQLLANTPDDLRKIRSFGLVSLWNVQRKLALKNLHLKGDRNSMLKFQSEGS